MVVQFADGIREITKSEIAFFRENGWVKLESLLAPELVGELLHHAQARMCRDGEVIGVGPREGRFEAWRRPSYENEWVNEFSHSPELGAIASAILDGRPVRWLQDIFQAKLPVAQSGGSTPWHQDLPYTALDRRGAPLTWIPLVDCPPEKGTMRFLSGSHRAGPLGRFPRESDGSDLVDYYPDIQAMYPISPPLYLKIGDATLHDWCVAHSAPENTTDSARWVYQVTWIDANTLYTGAPWPYSDGFELEVNKPFDHPKFPLIPARQ